MTSEPPRLVDTNVLVYAYDRSEGAKHAAASRIVSEIWRQGGGAVSLQILSEFFVVVTRKVQRPLDVSTARVIVGDFLASPSWKVLAAGPSTLLLATEIVERTTLSLWDALLVAAMQENGISTILTEDAAFAAVPGIRAENPFTKT